MTTPPLPEQIELHRDRMRRRDEEFRVESAIDVEHFIDDVGFAMNHDWGQACAMNHDWGQACDFAILQQYSARSARQHKAWGVSPREESLVCN